MIMSCIYETRPIMVSRKIKLQWNVLKIVIGVHFQSHKDYILQYISKILCGCNQVIKLSCGENCLWIAATKLDLRSPIEKNSMSGLITATEEAVHKTTHLGKMLYCVLDTFHQFAAR